MGVTSATDRNANICLAFCPPRASQGEITANCRLAIYRPGSDHLYTPRWDNPDFMSTDGTEDRDDDTIVSLLVIILEEEKIMTSQPKMKIQAECIGQICRV